MSTSPLLSPVGTAALQYARRGWPVFPCREIDQTIEIRGTDGPVAKILKAKAPYTGAGLKNATRDERQIEAWWRRWPNALIGLPMGGNGLFALDFDPRHDAETGEDFTLEQLKAAVEAQIGCALPPSLSVRTQSGGVHVYYNQPREGDVIRNRGNLPTHVDVRGMGGYVIAPPSVMADGGRYRWLHGRLDDPVADAPAALIEVLRGPKPAKARLDNDAAGGKPATASPSAHSPRSSREDPADVAVRKYALSALDDECTALAATPKGDRNIQINRRSFSLGQLVGAGALQESVVRAALQAIVHGFPHDGGDPSGALQTLENGLAAGMAQPRDLRDVAERGRARATRPSRAGPRASSSRPDRDDRNSPPSHAGGQGEQALHKGAGAGVDAALTLQCARHPLTDLGNLERFLERYGGDFLFVEAWGWLAWDKRRWNRDMALALLGRRIQQTMRAIQDEADFVRASGVPFPPDPDEEEDDEAAAESAAAERAAEQQDGARLLFDEGERKEDRKRTVLWYRQRQLARATGGEGPRHDYIVQVKSNGDIVLFSDKLAAWGRTSESAGHIGCISDMAEAQLSARTEDFDVDPLAINVQNGTLIFARPEDGRPASFEIRDHRREDKITKIARASYLAGATSPLFDAFLARVQPAADMREFLDRWAGYSALGLADAQKMALFYGEGQNGKGVWVQAHAHLLGDYAWSTGIETFTDADARKSSGPSPHLAALAGRRMVYANEPEDNSKFSDGLVKALTSDEPIGGVRELLKPPFELVPTFNTTVMANTLPRIGTDYGIRRRMQVVPFEVIIPLEERDVHLKTKLKAEMDGILNRLIGGALAYLNEGLNLPEASAEATRDYHETNDILAMFLDLCIARSPGDRMQSGALHALFAAWQLWAQQIPASGKPWSPRYLNAQMQRKGFKINKSSTMQWHDIVARFDVFDFAEDGRASTRPLPPARHPEKSSAGVPPRPDAAPSAPPDGPPAPPPARPSAWEIDDHELP